MSETVLTFQKAGLLNEHFRIPPDTAPWKGQVGTYTACYDKKTGKAVGFTPARDRATFFSLTQSMTPRTGTGTALNAAFGVYVLAFDLPIPALYVGIAASSSRKPEGVLGRIRKHRVKLTSSHIGSLPATFGGVNHTGGWREFASQRARYFSDQGTHDCASDARFAVGSFIPSGGPPRHKSEAEWFEGQLTIDGRLKDLLVSLLWPGRRSGDVFQLTTGSSSGQRPESPMIRFWDGPSVVLRKAATKEVP